MLTTAKLTESLWSLKLEKSSEKANTEHYKIRAKRLQCGTPNKFNPYRKHCGRQKSQKMSITWQICKSMHKEIHYSIINTMKSHDSRFPSILRLIFLKCYQLFLKVTKYLESSTTTHLTHYLYILHRSISYRCKEDPWKRTRQNIVLEGHSHR